MDNQMVRRKEKQSLAGRTGSSSLLSGDSGDSTDSKGKRPSRASQQGGSRETSETTTKTTTGQKPVSEEGQGMGSAKMIARPLPVAKPRRFTARDCTSCVGLRRELNDSNSYSRVTATIPGELGITRYCRCGFCGNTWKELQE